MTLFEEQQATKAAARYVIDEVIRRGLLEKSDELPPMDDRPAKQGHHKP